MKQYISIDRDLFRMELDKTKIPYQRISEGIGRSHSYLHLVIREGRINDTDAVKLERFYGVSQNAYRVASKTEQKQKAIPEREENEKVSCGIDYVRLYNTIYQAVLTALQENAKGLHDHLFEVK